MIDASNANSVTTLQLLASVDAADTAAASTATGLDVTEYEGFLIVTQNAGLADASATITGTVITSASSNLSSPTTVGTFTVVTDATDPAAQSIAIECRNLKQYIGYVGTVVGTGVLIGCSAVGTKKYV